MDLAGRASPAIVGAASELAWLAAPGLVKPDEFQDFDAYIKLSSCLQGVLKRLSKRTRPPPEKMSCNQTALSTQSLLADANTSRVPDRLIASVPDLTLLF